MLVYTVKRLGLSVAIILVATAVLFVMVFAIPGDPVSVALGPRASPSVVEAFRERMGLDQPLPIQMLRFYGNLLTGNLGHDVLSGRSVATMVLEQLPYSLTLIAGAMVWSVALGVPLGCYAAMRRGSAVDSIVGVLSVGTIAIPSFVVAIYLLLIFAIGLGWLPAIGAGRSGEFGDQLVHLILPSLAVGLGWVGYLARMVRSTMLEVMGESHIRMAHAFGLPPRLVIFKYALRIAILPTLTLLGLGIGQMLSGTVFAEIVFARPGVGQLVYDAVSVRNYPVVTGAVLVTTAFYVLATLAADLLVASLDPRIRTSLRQ
ncbi:MAG: ABC transporter permease [Rhodospirillaceae bacterium]|nr:ABC transporter permease [Rhodospirillaceae bacterium]